MRGARLLAVGLIALSSFGMTGTLSSRLHPDVVGIYNRAGDAAENGELQQALALIRGTLYTEPVRIAVEEDHAGRRALLQESVDSWKKVLDGDAPITVVSIADNPHMVVRYRPSIPADGEHPLGLIQLRKKFRWNREVNEYEVSGSIYICTRPAGGPLSRDEERDVLMHELGHLLGLDDVGTTGPLMGPLRRGSPSGGPHKDEVEAVQGLRKQLRSRLSVIQNYLKHD